MTKTDMSDPWAYKLNANLDDGGGAGFASGYDTSFTAPSPTVGCWRLNENFRIYVTKRPNRLNRFMTRFLLGWEWNDT
jgi:hypothetical protein